MKKPVERARELVMTKHGEVIDFLSEITAGKRTEIGLAPESQFGVSRRGELARRVG